MRWQRAQDEIAAAWNRIERGVEDVEGQFLAELGLSRTEVGVRGKAFAARWQDFQRWGVSFNRQIGVCLTLRSEIFRLFGSPTL